MIEREVYTRAAIEAKLSKVGDYVKIDYLTRCLKQPIDFDTKKFIILKLSGIYEQRKMFLEAAKLLKAGADINTTYQGKIDDYVKAMELFIKAGVFDEADGCYNKALACANDNQKIAIKISRKEHYKTQAKDYMQKDKRKHAMETYEKVLSLDLDPVEKKNAQAELSWLYEKLGKVREYYDLKKGM